MLYLAETDPTVICKPVARHVTHVRGISNMSDLPSVPGRDIDEFFSVPCHRFK